MIIDWIGYGLGAVTAETIGLKIFMKSGNTYALFMSPGNRDSVQMANVHPRTMRCGSYVDADDVIEHKHGVYPIRWFLNTSEIMDVIQATRNH
jgi:hypothetical protein